MGPVFYYVPTYQQQLSKNDNQALPLPLLGDEIRDYFPPAQRLQDIMLCFFIKDFAFIVHEKHKFQHSMIFFTQIIYKMNFIKAQIHF